MGHYGKVLERRFERTPKAWLRFGGQVADLTNEWAKREDVIAFVGEGAGMGAPACYIPAVAEMEVDTALCFGDGYDPKFLEDFSLRRVQLDHPVVSGAVLHEAMHARHTRWDLEGCAAKVKDEFEHQLVMAFEETRIEARGVQHFPGNRSFLRACAMKLVLAEFKETETVTDENGKEVERPVDWAARGHRALSELALLSLARVDAGVLDQRDVEKIDRVITGIYGEGLMGKLRGVWLRGQRAGDFKWEPLHKLAKEWIKLLEDAGHDTSQGAEVPDEVMEALQALLGSAAGGGEGDGEEGEGEGPGLLEQAADAAETRAGDEAADQAASERAEERAKEKQARAKEAKGNQDQAAQTFGRGTGPGPSGSFSQLAERRPPTSDERRAAVRLARDLDRAKYTDRISTKTAAAVPPGRLRTRAAMAADEQRSRGAMVTAAPWRSTKHRYVDDPTLKIGMMTDISGSMRRVMLPQGAANWIVSEAARRIQGKVASVYFGNDAWAALRPGQHLEQVEIYTASDGTEKFDKGFRALDGQMGLLDGTGARLLVVVSDLYHMPAEIEAERRWFRRCAESGVAVVVAIPEEGVRDGVENIVGKNGQVIRPDWRDPSSFAREVGEAAVRELSRLSRERSA
jgi:hypothetical protein